jgi:hypothetical protein
MYRVVPRLILALAVVGGCYYAWNHFRQSSKPAVSNEPEQEEAKPDPRATGELRPPEEKEAHHLVTFAGPLANYVKDGGTHSPSGGDAQEVDSLHTPSPTVAKEDHVEDSPVGTSERVVHKTFPVARAVHVAFDIPPHAATPHFHGTFQSFAQQGGAPSHDDTANVDLLLMNEDQYAEFIAGRDPDVLFVADTSHYQDIGYDLAPSRDKPVRYHLVFRNTPGGAAKKVVQADFSVDF